MKTAELIREKRKEKKLTQKQLGELMGWPEASGQVRVSNMESGLLKVPRTKMLILSKLLNIPIKELIQ